MAKSLVLVTVSGPDKPGITSSLMNVVVRDHIKIRDIGQAVTHGFLSLSFLLDFTHENGNALESQSPVLKDLLFEAKRLGMTLDFDVVEDRDSILNKGKQYILSAVSPQSISAGFIRDISTMLASHSINILRIDNSGASSFNKMEIQCVSPKGLNEAIFKEELLNISNLHKIDLAFLKDSVYKRSKRVIVFDMDSTIIQAEVVDELAVVAGVGEKIKAITERAMNGELDFNQSLKERVGHFKGMDQKVLASVAERIEITEGMQDFVKTVKKLGYKVGIISGGFTYFANYFKQKLGMDFAFANELEIIDGQLTGNVKGVIINAEQKASLVEHIAQLEGISVEQVVAVGDGANDLLMLAKAGLGIAFHAKEIVKRKAGHTMNHGPMTSLLHFLGIDEENT